MSRVAAIGLLALAATLGARPGAVQAQGARAQALVDQVIAVHGGMEAWSTLKDLAFTITSVTQAPTGDATGARVSLYYLKRPDKIRVETLTGQGLRIEGFDGRRPWVVLGGQPVTGADALKRAHFQAVNWWYWMGIPFKLRDPGVILRHQGSATILGLPVEVLDVTFEPGVGHTSDHFTYYVDPESHQIRFVTVRLQPGIWPGVGSSTPSWSAWLDYKPVGPFTMHTKRILYSGLDLGTKRAVALFADFRINSGLSDQLFTAP